MFLFENYLMNLGIADYYTSFYIDTNTGHRGHRGAASCKANSIKWESVLVLEDTLQYIVHCTS